MHVDGFVAKRFLTVLEANSMGIQLAVNQIVKDGAIELSGNYIDEWIGINVDGVEFDANFYVSTEKIVKCSVYPVVDGETITNVNIPASVLLH
jgi:hypothetical protein